MSSDLTAYPRPSVAVDVAVLTVDDESLNVVTVESRWGAALPGTFLHPGETLADAARRALGAKARIEGLRFHQLRMFDDPERDDRGWVLSMAHCAEAPIEALPPGTALMPVQAGRPAEAMAFDHADMVSAAVSDLRTRYAERPDPSRLLGDRFTLLDLRRLYDVVFDRSLPKDTFRRHVVGALTGTGTTTSASGGRPAELHE
ncbi:MAG: NUDIX domain-containing protein, partial [Rhodococcus sp. (in: high G+C Gram-positive bacteria)]